MALIIKNTTNTGIFVQKTGDLIPSQDELRIEPQNYGDYSSAVELGTDSEDTDFTSALQSGDLVVSDGVEDFSEPEGIRYLKTLRKITVSLQNTIVEKILSGIDFTGLNIDVTTNSGQVTVNINSASKVSGDLYVLSFSENSTTKNEYINSGVDGTGSNETPHVIPFRSKVMAYTFSNSNSDSDTDIQIYSVAENNGNSPTTLEDTWVLRNARTARKTNFLSDVIFEAGDKVTVYFRDRGSNPSDVVFKIYLKILEESSVNNIETWSGDIEPE